MNSTDFLGRMVRAKIDRPLGSRNPIYHFPCLLNYRYIPGVIAPDGEELNAYILGIFEPVSEFEGRCIAVIQRLDDQDDKLVLAPEDKEYSDEQILALVDFQEQFFKPVVVRKKHSP